MNVIRLDRAVLTQLGVAESRVDRYLLDLDELLPQHGVDTPLRLAHFLAQVLHESGFFRLVEEDLNYSADGLLKTFAKYFSPSQAQAYARNPPAIGSRVYANRMGNGAEHSGDGYRFRGRGLLQLTGKQKYRDFSTWIGDDVVAHPDRVADQYAAHSAVYFWHRNALNDLADADDLKRLTYRVNGGYNGLPRRLALLDRAKAALRANGAVVTLGTPTHSVTATHLMLRSQPRVAPSNLIAALPQGTPVVKIADVADPDWMKVRVLLNGQLAQGFVKAEYLASLQRNLSRLLESRAAARAFGEIPTVHLQERRGDITRRNDNGRAFPLGEPNMPRRSGLSPEGKATQLLDIVNYLNCENRMHGRYAPQTTATYCNVYAYDFCYLAGVFLPRVFWTAPALLRLQRGEAVPVRYGDTVRELSANALHDWLQDFGQFFGWNRAVDLDTLQAAANAGEVCLIVAKRKQINQSGHIVAIAPERDARQAARNAQGEVLRAVETQAGARNYRFVVKPNAWWRSERFQSFAFWRHA